MIELSNNSETPTTWYNMNDDESDDMILGIPYGSDVNGDRGVAHYGLVPDFWKKMSTNSDIVDINATFNSAEAYIRMIERAEKYSDTYPSRDESQWITTSTEYWH